MDFNFKPIGVIHTPYKEKAGMPIQAVFGDGVEGTIEVFDEYAAGLDDLEGISHVFLIYVFHRSQGFKLKITPFRDNCERGLFATRAPKRPNPIGLSIVRILGVEGNVIRVADLDMLDGTPLLDIKPFNPAIDHRDNCSLGWMDGRFEKHQSTPSDDRFNK